MRLFKALATLSFFVSMWLTAMSVAQLTWVMVLSLTVLIIAAMMTPSGRPVVLNANDIAVKEIIDSWVGQKSNSDKGDNPK